MAPRRPSLRLTTPSFLLALALVAGSASPTIARDATLRSPDASRGVAARSDRPNAAPEPVVALRPQVAPRAAWREAELSWTRDPRPGPAPAMRPPTPDVPVARAVAIPRPTGATGTSTSSETYQGRNHVWIPGLGVSRSVAWFACTSKAYPGNRVYRWGCAGSNNVYLFGHAHSVFQPLHDAYVSGRLRKGMELFYAGSDGIVHRYTVRWWKVTTPDKGAWAYAGQSRPSLTLQTCVGARSQYRLVIRLVRSD